jgi:hypothetical protein
VGGIWDWNNGACIQGAWLCMLAADKAATLTFYVPAVVPCMLNSSATGHGTA